MKSDSCPAPKANGRATRTKDFEYDLTKFGFKENDICLVSWVNVDAYVTDFSGDEGRNYAPSTGNVTYVVEGNILKITARYSWDGRSWFDGEAWRWAYNYPKWDIWRVEVR